MLKAKNHRGLLNWATLKEKNKNTQQKLFYKYPPKPLGKKKKDKTTQTPNKTEPQHKRKTTEEALLTFKWQVECIEAKIFLGLEADLGLDSAEKLLLLKNTVDLVVKKYKK